MNTGADRHCTNRELAIGWALHALEPDDEAAFARHLPGCAECTAEADATEDMAVLLGADVPQHEPPARLRAAVLNAARSPQVPRQSQPVGMTPREGEVTHVSPRRIMGPGLRSTGRFTRSRRVLVAAAAALVLGFGAAAGWVGSNVFSQQSTPSVSALQDSNVAAAIADPAVHKVVLTEKDSSEPMALLLAGPTAAMVMPMHMPSAADNTQYVVWGMTSMSDTKPVALGGLNSSGASGGVLNVAATGKAMPASFNAYAVSVEAAGTVPAAPTTVVATGRV